MASRHCEITSGGVNTAPITNAPLRDRRRVHHRRGLHPSGRHLAADARGAAVAPPTSSGLFARAVLSGARGGAGRGGAKKPNHAVPGGLRLRFELAAVLRDDDIDVERLAVAHDLDPRIRAGDSSAIRASSCGTSGVGLPPISTTTSRTWMPARSAGRRAATHERARRRCARAPAPARLRA